jgi:hypothetical protein
VGAVGACFIPAQPTIQRVDTIVVASNDNEIKATAALKSLRVSDPIKVTDLNASNT